MFKQMKLSTKLLLIFLGVGIIPAFAIGYMLLDTSSKSLSKQAFNQLEGVREIKKSQIESFFEERKGDARVLSETVGTLRSEAFSKLKAVHEIKKNQIEDYFDKVFLNVDVLARSKDTSILFNKLKEYHIATNVKPDGPYDVATTEYKAIGDEFSGTLNQFWKESGFYDVFIVCADHGHVMFTSARESDLGTNLRYGPFKESGLRKVLEKVIANSGNAIVDFEPYAPSNNEPAAFAGTPIYENDKIIGTMVVQLSLDHINNIMAERTGLGGRER